jgi:hypothetical protein
MVSLFIFVKKKKKEQNKNEMTQISQGPFRI